MHSTMYRIKINKNQQLKMHVHKKNNNKKKTIKTKTVQWTPISLLNAMHDLAQYIVLLIGIHTESFFD